MTLPSTLRHLLAVACLATIATAGAAESDASAKAKEAAKAATADARKSSQELITKMIADHEALAKQLKDATDAQRKEIIAKMEEQKKNFEEAFSALVKQQREDARRLRQNAAAGKR